MQKLIFVVLLFCVIFSQTQIVPGETTGDYYNKALKITMKKSIYIYIDKNENVYVHGGSSQLPFARGFLNKSERKDFVKLLHRSLDWSEKASDNEVEITKKLGSFMKEEENKTYGMNLTFCSSDEGDNTNLILEIIDFENQLQQLTLNLDDSEVSDLIDLFERIPKTTIALRKQIEISKSLE